MKMGKTALDAIAAKSGALARVALAMWEQPEQPFAEYKAMEWCAELLEEAGFAVERGVGGVPTALKASYGRGGPVVALLGEFDALPGLSQKVAAEKQPVVPGGWGQGCGHNLLALEHVGAALGVKAELEKSGGEGTVVFYGCPAEEILVGKGFMARGGAFEGIDFSFASHPGKFNAVNLGSAVALNSVRFHFHGKTAHAGGDPHNGRSALDAVELMNVGANYLREHVPTDVRIHYTITDGGLAPNIVPDYAASWYYVRAPRRERVEEVYARLLQVAEGAAMMTGTTLEAEYQGGCYETLNNPALVALLDEVMRRLPRPAYTQEELAFAQELNEAYAENAQSLRRLYNLAPHTQIHTGVLPILNEQGHGSTDVGDVQHIAPGAMFTTACTNLASPGHSWQVTACAGSSIGLKGMEYAARVMALATLRLMQDRDLQSRAREEFARQTDGQPYICPIPAELPLPTAAP